MKTMRGFSKLIGGVVGLAIACVAGTGNASLINDDIDFLMGNAGNPNANTQLDVPIAAGLAPDIEFSVFNWNVESSSVLFSLDPVALGTKLGNGVFFVLSDLDWVGDPTGILIDASIVQATGLFAPATDGILTVGDHSLTVDLTLFTGGFLEGEPSILISLETDHSVVPEPTALALFVIALGGLGFMMRRRAA